MSKEEFLRQSEAAVKRMREMNNRAGFKGTPHKMPPTPSFVRPNTAPSQIEKHETQQNIKNANDSIKMQGAKSNFSLPFLDMLKTDSDMPIIIGLLLLLMSESGDKRLLFALLYILM